MLKIMMLGKGPIGHSNRVKKTGNLKAQTIERLISGAIRLTVLQSLMTRYDNASIIRAFDSEISNQAVDSLLQTTMKLRM